MPGGVRLEKRSELMLHATATSANLDIKKLNSSTENLVIEKPPAQETKKNLFNNTVISASDRSATMGCSKHFETSSSNSPSPIMGASPTNVNQQEGVSNHNENSYRASANRNAGVREGSPLSPSFCSGSDDRASADEGSPTGFLSCNFTNGSSALESFRPALTIHSPQQSGRSFSHISRLGSFPLASTSAKYPTSTAISSSVIRPSFTQTINKMTQIFDTSRLQSHPSSKLNFCSDEVSKSPSLPESTLLLQPEDNYSISATPHGIENILNRPIPRPDPVISPVTQCHPQSSSSNQYPSPFSAITRSQKPLDFSNGVNGIGLNSPTFTGVYWPTLQSFIDNPALQSWRERFQISKDTWT